MNAIHRTIMGLVCAAGAAACASSNTGTTEVAALPTTQQVTLSTQQSVALNITPSSVAVAETMSIGPDSAYALLIKVYGDLNIPTTSMDTRLRQVGNGNFKLRRRLGGVTLVKYLECGTKDGLPNAETYDIILSVTSAVTAATKEGGAIITTRVDAVGSNPSSGGGTQVMCSTTGELEKRLATAVKQKAGLK